MVGLAKSLKKTSAKLLFGRAPNASFSSLAGTPYLWGRNRSESLGRESSVGTKTGFKTDPPKKLEFFDENFISQASCGYYHTSLVTKDGELYTMGYNKYGQLGTGDKATHKEPTLVTQFAEEGLKIKQALCGEHHTVALADDGSVWTWGYGGKEVSWLRSLVSQTCGALGHGDNAHKLTPTKVEKLGDFPPIKSIATGSYHTLALDVEGDIHVWGRGEYGVLGLGENQQSTSPLVMELFSNMRAENGLKVERIDAAHWFSVALLSNGDSLGWGRNDGGQLGTGQSMGFDVYDMEVFPTALKGVEEKIIDFACGENTSIYLAESGKVYIAGGKIYYDPILLPLPEDFKPVKVACGFGTYSVIAEDGRVAVRGTMFHGTPQDKEQEKAALQLYTTDHFDGGKFVDFGGQYRNYYALIEK